jgi:hypothetical protein
MVLALLVPALASASSSGPAADVAVPAGKSDAPATGGYNVPLQPVVPGSYPRLAFQCLRRKCRGFLSGQLAERLPCSSIRSS